MSKDFKDTKKPNSKGSRYNSRKDGKYANKNKYLDNETRKTDGMIDCQDPFWYAKDQKAIENMASYPWNAIVGDAYPGLGPVAGSKDKTPAIIVYPVWHAIGSGDTSRNNYLTRAADSYYQYVTQGFTGGVDFEAPDLLFTALAAESLIASLIEGKRAYGLLNYYLQYNKYYARTIIEALGFDFDDLKSNMANFRTQYNIRVSQLNKILAVPKSFFIGDRWEYLSSWIFTDTDSPEYSTAYAYSIMAALKYEATAITTGTSLSWAPKGSDKMTVSQFFGFIDNLTNAMIDSDVRAIFGAVRRVYDESQLKVLSELEESFTTTLVRNDVVAMAIHNTMPMAQFQSSVTSVNSPSTFLPLTQSPEGAIVTNIYGNYIGGSATVGDKTYPCSYEPDALILDMYDHIVNPGNVLDATANMTALDYTDRYMTDAGGIILNRIICRSEIISLPRVFSINDATGQMEVTYAPVYISNNHFSFAANSNGATWHSQEAIDRISKFSHLDSHTIMRVMCTPTKQEATIGGKATTAFKFSGVQTYVGEIDRYTALTVDELKAMHETSQFQLLSMPSNTKSVTR